MGTYFYLDTDGEEDDEPTGSAPGLFSPAAMSNKKNKGGKNKKKKKSKK